MATCTRHPVGRQWKPVINALVIRGPDWKWGSQDEESGLGILLMDEHDGWARVRWLGGGEHSHRIGAEGAFDLHYARVRHHRHAHTLYTAACATGWYCDLCQQSGMDGIRWHCHRCDWDACFACMRKYGHRGTYRCGATELQARGCMLAGSHGTHGVPSSPRASDQDFRQTPTAFEASNNAEAPGVISKKSCRTAFKVGDQVRVKRSITQPRYGWTGVTRDMRGTITRVCSDGDYQVDFPTCSRWNAVLEDLELATFQVGDKVRMKRTISTPRFQWDNVTRDAVGTVERIDEDGAMIVNFPELAGCRTLQEEMELAPDSNFSMTPTSSRALLGVDHFALCPTMVSSGRRAVGEKWPVLLNTLVTRGPDWKWENQDGADGLGILLETVAGNEGWVRVCWLTGSKNAYRAGVNGKFDLHYAEAHHHKHGHALIVHSRNGSWHCDVCRENNPDGIRWRCDGCDFDACSVCMISSGHRGAYRASRSQRCSLESSPDRPLCWHNGGIVPGDHWSCCGAKGLQAKGCLLNPSYGSDVGAKFKVDDKVRVKQDVKDPDFGLMSVEPESGGTVKSVGTDDRMTMDFPAHAGWSTCQDELEIAPSDVGHVTTGAPSNSATAHADGDPMKWDTKAVGKWLKDIGLGEFAERFEKDGVEGPDLFTLEPNELGQLGLGVGHRKKYARAIHLLEAQRRGEPHGTEPDCPHSDYSGESADTGTRYAARAARDREKAGKDADRMEDGIADAKATATHASFYPPDYHPHTTPFEFIDTLPQDKFPVSAVKRMVADFNRRVHKMAREQQAGLGRSDMFTIFTYSYELDHPKCTHQIYREVNRCMRERDVQELEFWQPYIYFLDKALQTLGCGEVTLYRSLSLAFPVNVYFEGALVTWPAFSSSSMAITVAQEFLKGKFGSGKNAETQGTIFSIKAYRAYQVRTYSRFPKEEEVLFPPNSTFRVVRRLEAEFKKVMGISCDMIQLEQVDPGSAA